MKLPRSDPLPVEPAAERQPHPAVRILALLTAAASIAFVLAELAALWDLYSFEWALLLQLVLAAGAATILVLNCALLVLAGRAIDLFRGRSRRHHIASNLLLLAGRSWRPGFSNGCSWTNRSRRRWRR
jgi:hypothetical protein